jgi:hypothetical protein
LRLGEIAVARGQDAATSMADVAQAEQELAAANTSTAAAVQDIEPPDDLDLTARAFGPANAWQDDEQEGGDGAEAVADVPPDVVQPDVVQLDDVTLGGVETEAESPAPAAAPEPVRVAASQPEALSEHELTAPDVSIAEDAGAAAFDLAAELSVALVDGAPATRAGASTGGRLSSLFSEFKRACRARSRPATSDTSISASPIARWACSTTRSASSTTRSAARCAGSTRCT